MIDRAALVHEITKRNALPFRQLVAASLGLDTAAATCRAPPDRQRPRINDTRFIPRLARYPADPLHYRWGGRGSVEDGAPPSVTDAETDATAGRR
jgi:hypothetical protein